MTAQTRPVLKSYFQRGLRPTQSNYADLIDSFFLVSGDTPDFNGGTFTSPTIITPTVSAGTFTSPSLITPVLGAASATSLSFSSTSGIIGTTTNDSAAAGSVGEYLENIVLIGSAVSMTTGVGVNITSISLTPGDWDIVIDGYFTGNAATTVSGAFVSISNISATLNISPGRLGVCSSGGNTLFSVGQLAGCVAGPFRLSVAITTTIFFVANANFAVSTMSCFGIIRARRIR